MAKRIKSKKEIRVGDFYEDCAFHPCLCISVGEGTEAQVEGISLVNGGIRGCNARHCGLRLLTVEEAISWKLNGPADQTLDEGDRWWKQAQLKS